MKHIRADLEFYLDRKPTDDEVLEAENWMLENPRTNLCEWVDAMMEAGLLS